MPAPDTRLVRIPRPLLHLTLHELTGLAVPESDRLALRTLLGDLPLVPTAADSAVLVGPPAITLPSLVVVARHAVEGLRSHNISVLHDRSPVGPGRLRLMFLDGDAIAPLLAADDPRLLSEAVLCAPGAPETVLALLLKRRREGRASFVTTTDLPPALASWRVLYLGRGPNQLP